MFNFFMASERVNYWYYLRAAPQNLFYDYIQSYTADRITVTVHDMKKLQLQDMHNCNKNTVNNFAYHFSDNFLDGILSKNI